MMMREPQSSWQPSIGLVGFGLLASLPGASAQPAPAAPAAPAPTVPASGVPAPGAPVPGAPVALPELNVSTSAPSRYRADQTVVPHMPTSVQDAPQTINVIPRALIDERGAVSLREALRNVTGISLAAGEGGLSGDNLTLRGFSATNDFYIDGIRDAAAYTRDPFNVESIEVLKGPSSIMFGRGTTGGVINQTTRMPEQRNFGEFNVTGMAPAGIRGTADINMSVDQVSVRLNAMGMHQNVADRNHVYSRRFGVAPSITWGLGTDTQASLSYMHQDEDNRPDFGVPFIAGRPAPVDRKTYYGLNNVDHERYTTDVVTGTLQHRFADGITVRNVTRYGSYERDISATAPRIIGTVTANTPLANIMVNRQAQIRAGISSILENQTELRLQATTGPLEHAMVVGVEVGRESAQLRRWTATRPIASLVSPAFDQLPGYQDARTLTSDVLAVANRAAVFAVDQIKIGRYFEVLLGARFERFRGTLTTRSAVGQNFGRTDDMTSWRGALVFKPVPGVRTYFAAGTSFNPSVESLTLTVANANLAPEKNQSMEFGGSWDVTTNLQLRGALFRIEKTNARTVDPTTATVNVLQGNQRVEGFELSAAGALMPGWNIIAGYTYLDARVEKSNVAAEVGSQLLNTPRNTATVWSTYDLPWGITIGGGASYIDDRYGNNTNTVRVPAYVRYDATIAWNISEGLTARLNGLNLTDKQFYEGVYQGNTTPGAGRTIMGSLTARF